MNYLAHLYLADDHPEVMLGGLMGDFIKGTVPAMRSAELRHGVLQHRRIDAFTDRHPRVGISKSRLGPEFRRYGPILVDMFYDHFLARHWSSVSDESLHDFSTRVYQMLELHWALLPERMHRIARYMIANDLLTSYLSIDGIDRALQGIATRLKRPSPLGMAIGELEREYPALEADFLAFLPEVRQFAVDDHRQWELAGRVTNDQ